MDKPKILVVDDVPENIHTLKNLLKENYNIVATTQGKKAIELVQKDLSIDLIILDIIMPDMDGYEVCKILKTNEQTKNIPIIFVTSLNDLENEEKGIEIGGEDYIHKPVNPTLILKKVATQIELKKYKDRFGTL